MDVVRPPSPTVVSYGHWSNASSFQIQERYEPLPVFVPRRKSVHEKISPYTHEVKRSKDAFSIPQVLVMDSNGRAKTASEKGREPRICEERGIQQKPALVRRTKTRGVEIWESKTVLDETPRAQWLYSSLRPESHYTGPKKRRPISLSEQVRELAKFIAIKPVIESRGAQTLDITEEPIPLIQDYVSTEGKDFIATINKVLSVPATDSPKEKTPGFDKKKTAVLGEKTTDIEEGEKPVFDTEETQEKNVNQQIQDLEEKVKGLNGPWKRTEYQAEFTFGNSSAGMREMRTTFKPKEKSQVSYFL